MQTAVCIAVKFELSVLHNVCNHIMCEKLKYICSVWCMHYSLVLPRDTMLA